MGLMPVITRESALAPEGRVQVDRRGAHLSASVVHPDLATVSRHGNGAWAIRPRPFYGAWILGASAPFSAFIQILEAVFVARGNAKAIVVQYLVESVFKVSISLPLVWHGYGVSAVLAVFVLSRGIGLLLLLKPLMAIPLALPLVWDRAKTRCLMAKAKVFSPMIILASLNMRLDLLILSLILTESAVGIYGPAIRLVNMIFLVPDSLVSAIYPRFAQQLEQDPAMAVITMQVAVRAMFAILQPICSGLRRVVALFHPDPFWQGVRGHHTFVHHSHPGYTTVFHYRNHGLFPAIGQKGKSLLGPRHCKPGHELVRLHHHDSLFRHHGPGLRRSFGDAGFGRSSPCRHTTHSVIFESLAHHAAVGSRNVSNLCRNLPFSE